jgi:pyruvate formate lyase activating enzyme
VSRSVLTLGGLTRFSTVDYPGRLAAVLFTQGCPLRCRYCHNGHLLQRTPTQGVDWGTAVAWLRRRRGLLDAVVFSGGEPTIQPGLVDAIAEVRDMGFAIGLHTAGTHPQRLAELLPLLDWVGMDVKAPFDRYAAITGSAGSGARARRAMESVLASGVSHEFRTTVHAALLGAEDLLAIAGELHAHGVHRWVLQSFRTAGCRDAELLAQADTGLLNAMLPSLSRLVDDIVIR